VVLQVFLAGLFAFPGSAGQDPYHVHIVLGGTPAERARALTRHLLDEREGIDDAFPPEASPGGGQADAIGVHVFSVRGSNDVGPAVFSTEGSGALLAATVPQIPVPADVSWVRVPVSLSASQTAPFLLDPPPR
jgi:hypothetical protein